MLRDGKIQPLYSLQLPTTTPSTTGEFITSVGEWYYSLQYVQTFGMLRISMISILTDSLGPSELSCEKWYLWYKPIWNHSHCVWDGAALDLSTGWYVSRWCWINGNTKYIVMYLIIFTSVSKCQVELNTIFTWFYIWYWNASFSYLFTEIFIHEYINLNVSMYKNSVYKKIRIIFVAHCGL